MENKIKDFLEKSSIIIDKPVICAVSGGVDSVCMLEVLHKLGYKVVLAHVNHHKRQQSEIEAQSMEKLAMKLNIPFELLNYYYDGNDNFHNDSHNARYNFFRELCKKYNTNIISTAHHLDDQIETILIKLMEGSNLYGYGGISISYNDGEYRVIRPLLCTTKEELYSYAKENNLVYFEDSSNFENDFLRNRLRHFVVPLLKKECPDLANKTLEYNIQLKEAFSYIRGQSIEYLDKFNNEIDLDSYNNLNIALKKDIASLLLERYNIRKNNNIILSIVELLKSKDGSKSLDLDNHRLIKAYDRAYIADGIEIHEQIATIDLNTIGYYNNLKLYFSKNKPTKGEKHLKLCYNRLALPLTIRAKIDGDSINTLIGNKKLSRVFIDYKIPKDKRALVPIIVDGNSNILWVYDLIKSKEVYDMRDNGDIYLICEEI